ncbi:oligosaccharide flippase family protein [uncultured Vibrio sp.]|uniref:oligosaccharide flippase family protein n=1 Tax=uncultured Vibrio sp. TaxID=114054 RepID=UPI0029C9A905|nr:oligosaccharide flippase family protein [uncultured Vibrio sp.]
MNYNIIFLSLIQILKFVVPIITFPYLTRTLGVEQFGYLAFSTAVMSYSMIICQYGFDFSATSKIAKIRESKSKMDLYCSGVYYSKFILFFVSLSFASLFLFFYNDSVLIKLSLCMLPMILGTLLLPTWLYQGVELMKQLVFITLISRVIVIPFVFIYVESGSDIYLAGFLQGLPFLISGCIALLYVKANKLFGFKRCSIKYVFLVTKSGWNVFLTSVASSVYLTLIPIVIGVFHGPISVGYFNVADTIKKVCISFFRPIYQTVFPRVSSLVNKNEDEARIIINKYFKICVILAISGGAFVVLLLEEIITIVSGKDFLEASNTVVIMMAIVIISVFNNFLGVQSLIPTKNDKTLKRVVVVSSILCLIFMTPVVYYFDYVGSAFLILFTELIVMFGLCMAHFYCNVNLIFNRKKSV